MNRQVVNIHYTEEKRTKNRSSWYIQKDEKTKLEDVKAHQRKSFVTLSGFWPLRGWGVLSESVKK